MNLQKGIIQIMPAYSTCRRCRYVRLNALNVPHVPRPRFIAPLQFCHPVLPLRFCCNIFVILVQDWAYFFHDDSVHRKIKALGFGKLIHFFCCKFKGVIVSLETINKIIFFWKSSKSIPISCAQLLSCQCNS